MDEKQLIIFLLLNQLCCVLNQLLR